MNLTPPPGVSAENAAASGERPRWVCSADGGSIPPKIGSENSRIRSWRTIRIRESKMVHQSHRRVLRSGEPDIAAQRSDRPVATVEQVRLGKPAQPGRHLGPAERLAQGVEQRRVEGAVGTVLDP